MRPEDFIFCVLLVVVLAVFGAFARTAWVCHAARRRRGEQFSIWTAVSDFCDVCLRLIDLALGLPGADASLLEDGEQASARNPKAHAIVGSGRSHTGVSKRKKKGSTAPGPVGPSSGDAGEVDRHPTTLTASSATLPLTPSRIPLGTRQTAKPADDDDIGGAPSDSAASASSPSRASPCFWKRLGAEFFTDMRPGKGTDAQLAALADMSKGEFLDGLSLWDVVSKRNRLHVAAAIRRSKGRHEALGFAVHRVQQPMLQVLYLGVSPGDRRQGVGRALMQSLQEEARQHPQCLTILTLVPKEEAEEQIQFLRAVGFQRFELTGGSSRQVCMKLDVKKLNKTERRQVGSISGDQVLSWAEMLSEARRNTAAGVAKAKKAAKNAPSAPTPARSTGATPTPVRSAGAVASDAGAELFVQTEICGDREAAKSGQHAALAFHDDQLQPETVLESTKPASVDELMFAAAPCSEPDMGMHVQLGVDEAEMKVEHSEIVEEDQEYEEHEEAQRNLYLEGGAWDEEQDQEEVAEEEREQQHMEELAGARAVSSTTAPPMVLFDVDVEDDFEVQTEFIKEAGEEEVGLSVAAPDSFAASSTASGAPTSSSLGKGNASNGNGRTAVHGATAVRAPDVNGHARWRPSAPGLPKDILAAAVSMAATTGAASSTDVGDCTDLTSPCDDAEEANEVDHEEELEDADAEEELRRLEEEARSLEEADAELNRMIDHLEADSLAANGRHILRASDTRTPASAPKVAASEGRKPVTRVLNPGPPGGWRPTLRAPL